MSRGRFVGTMFGIGGAMAIPLPMKLCLAEEASAPPMNQTTNNCFQPGKPWLDTDGVHINAHGGGLLYNQGRYYCYGEFKIEGEAGNTAQVGISCYSSSDLYYWKNEGIVLPVTDEAGHDLERGCILERPKVLQNKSNGTFVLWTHYERKGNGYGRFGGEYPRGAFKCMRAFRPNGQMSRDMTFFMDEDGMAWQVRSSEGNATLQLVRLTPDYLDCEPDFARAFDHTYPEAPALIFHDGWYHLIASHCSGWAPNAARHAVAQNVAGPWKELGNPAVGQDSDITFNSQSTYLLKPAGSNTVIYLGDRWTPNNPIDGTYIWLPLEINGTDATLRWCDSWRLSDDPLKSTT